jgi:Family of unknown function (DUF6416)
MADKQITVAVPEERVPEFYAWFASFLAAQPGAAAPLAAGGPRGSRGHRRHGEAQAWSAHDADQAAWLYRKLAPQARELFDLLAGSPGARFGGEDIAKRLKLEKGAHGVAGILAWPGRYSRHLERTLPIATEGRPDGGTDYYMQPELAELFAAARASSPSAPTGRRSRRRRER